MPELRLFISSTFRDLQEEREHLVKRIFPEIRALCRQRGVTFTEIDLRWGLTEDEGTYGRIIRTCLDEVDRCRPYFIGITGNRYGYIPQYLEIQKDAELLRHYPWVEQAVMDEMSITAMEMQYALTPGPSATGSDEPSRDAGRARFYFRRERASLEEQTADDDVRRLDGLKSLIRASGAPIQDYRDAASLGEMVYDDLIGIIRQDFADARPPTPLEEERTRHAAFSASRRHAYIADVRHLKRINEWFAGEEPPLVIYAESGSGKSSLVAFWCEQLRRRRPETFVVEHYVGIGAGDSDHLGLIRHIMEEIKERFARDEELPEKPEEIERGFGRWLGYAAHELSKRNERMALVLDGLNQLSGRALSLLWIPDVTAPQIRLILTSTVEETLVGLRKRGWGELGMQPLREAEREAVVVRFLSEYHKTLPGGTVKQISDDPKCSHPLFLRTLLEEARLFGEHDRIDEHLERLLASTGTEDLFQRVLERMEDDYSQRVVRDVMSLVWCSRGGLSEEELTALTAISRLKLSTLLLGLDYHLVRRDGLLSFFHDYLRRAVEKRYLSDEKKRQTYAQLAGHFERADVTLRTTLELMHALEMLDDRARLEAALSEITRFELLWRSDRYEVLRLWSERDHAAMAAVYSAGLVAWVERESPTVERRAELLGRLVDMYCHVANWRDAERMQLDRLTLLREMNYRADESRALSSLSNLASYLGRIAEAERLCQSAEELARESGDRRSIAVALGTRGQAHNERGEYEEALACYREQEEIVRELDDRDWLSGVIINTGFIHAQRGEHDAALECYRQGESICRELGNRNWLKNALGNRGLLLSDRGEYDAALACYREQEEIARELGDRWTIAFVLGSRGRVHSNRAEYDEALSCFREQEEIARDLGDRRTIASAIGERGIVHSSRGEYDAALECFREWEALTLELGDRKNAAIAVGNRGDLHSRLREYDTALTCFKHAAEEHRASGFGHGLTYWLVGTANALLELVINSRQPDANATMMPAYLTTHIPGIEPDTWQATSLRRASQDVEECLAISRELSKPDTIFISQLLLARIAAADGRRDAASQHLTSMLNLTPDDSARAEVYYWLWRIEGNNDHHVEALRLYEALHAKAPTNAHRLRINELTAANEPPTSARHHAPE